jgi:inner membrane protein
LVESREYAHFLPEVLNITGDISPEVRYRGIYEVIVYNSRINLSGSFSSPKFQEWKIDNANIIWEDAFLSLGLSDLRSIQENIAVKWNDKQYFFNPGVESNDVIHNGISTRLAINRSDSIAGKSDFTLALNFNGSSSLNFIPLGKVTKVNIKSKWKNPSFDGAFLPDSRNINENGFTANWQVLHLNRPYPQSFRGPAEGIEQSSFGVNLIVPVDEYQKSMRSAKYAVMFIALTFLIFFFVQILNGVRIHPIQYIMVGLALCVFYTLLIALSEHISFLFSYLISSVAIISLITLYAKTIFNNSRLTMLICLILTILYLFIYSIIQMEDYALLMGSIGLFIVLATIMYLSRKINWYALKTKGDETVTSD